MELKDDKEGIIPLSKETEEQLGIWYNNINLKIDLAKEIEKKDKEIDKLNNIINEFDKLLIEHIKEARYELNIILHSDNNLDYKNECAREFDILDKNIRMILDKLKELKEDK